MTKLGILSTFYIVADSKDNRKRPKRGQQKLRGYYLILSVIAVLLLFIVGFLEMSSRKAEYAGGFETEISEKEPDPPETPPKEEDFSSNDGAVIYGEPEKPAETVTMPVPESVPENPKPGSKGTLVFVIDDVGNSLEDLDNFLKIPGPIVFAVMPKRRYTEESIRRIKAAGKSVIVHQPMEPMGDSDPGKGAILVNMEEAEIVKVLDANLETTGPVDGINNHMGSRVTTDPDTMRIIMKYLDEKGMFFLDSVTNTNLVGNEIAREIGLPYLKRNSMFLDNDSERESVLAAIKEGQNTAVSKGHAVMIGHVMTDSLAELLIELYPTFMEDGFTIKDLSELLRGEYDVSAWD